MNTDRLILMSTMLGEIHAGTWMGAGVKQGVNGFDLRYWALNYHECGFSACAVGHAIFDPRFQALGLHASGVLRPVFKADGESFRDWKAVGAFFEIDIPTYSSLFLDEYYFPECSSWERAKFPPVQAIQVKARVDELLIIGPDAMKEKYPGPNEDTIKAVYFENIASVG